MARRREVSTNTSTVRPKEVYFPDQRSLLDQMMDVHAWAQREGMYDACEWLERNYFGTCIDGAEK